VVELGLLCQHQDEDDDDALEIGLGVAPAVFYNF